MRKSNVNENSLCGKQAWPFPFLWPWGWFAHPSGSLDFLRGVRGRLQCPSVLLSKARVSVARAQPCRTHRTSCSARQALLAPGLPPCPRLPRARSAAAPSSVSCSLWMDLGWLCSRLRSTALTLCWDAPPLMHLIFPTLQRPLVLSLLASPPNCALFLASV